MSTMIAVTKISAKSTLQTMFLLPTSEPSIEYHRSDSLVCDKCLDYCQNDQGTTRYGLT